jgi:hypothetical protein
MVNKKRNSRNHSQKGKPTKDEDKLISSINLKLTTKDFNSVKEKAEKPGMTPTQYAREMTLKGSVKSCFTLEELDMMRKLSGMANNLNQIARQANKSGFSISAMEVIKINGQIKELFHDS